MKAPSMTASDFDSCRGRSPRRSFTRLFLFVFAAALSIALLTSSIASAATKYVPVEQFPPPYPEFFDWTPHSVSGRSEGVAVSGKNGHIYATDSDAGKVYDYESTFDKTPGIWTGSTTPAGSFGERVSVAVDDTTGDVYVGDVSHDVVVKFDEAGNLITSFGDSTPSADGQLKGLATPDGSFDPQSAFHSVLGIAVNQATQNLYVIDAGHEVVDVFDSSGSYLRQITATPEGLYREGGDGANGIAVSAATGNVYLADLEAHQVYQFDNAGDYVSTWNGSDLPNGADSKIPRGSFGGGSQSGSLGVAVRDATGEVVVGSSYIGSSIDLFDEEGNYLPPSAPVVNAASPAPEGIAIDQDTGKLFVPSFWGGNIAVYIPTVVPDAAIHSASDVGFTSATLSGNVDPAGAGNITDCHFEYIEESRYRLNVGGSWDEATHLPCETAPPSSPPFTGPTDVSAEATGLDPGHRYQVRLVAVSSGGSNFDVAAPIVTPGEYDFSETIGAPGSGDGQLDEPEDVAVDDTTGDIYVADTGNHRVVKLDASGEFAAAWGWGVSDGSSARQVCGSGCEAGLAGEEPGQFDAPRYIEVDNSGGPSAHDVYVADAPHGTVQKFTPSGDLIQSWGDSGEFDFSADGEIRGMTVSTVGDLYVAMSSPYVWNQLGQDGLFRVQYNTGNFSSGLGQPGTGGIEVSGSGGFFQAQPAGFEGGVYHRNFANSVGSQHSIYSRGYSSSLFNTGLTLDRVSSTLFVAQKSYVDQFKPHPGCVLGILAGFQPVGSCPPDDTFGFGHLTGAAGLALDATKTRLYVADAAQDHLTVFDRISMPDTVTGPAVQQGSDVEMSGHVAPGPSDAVVACRFEYGRTSAYELGSVPCSPGGSLSSPTDVTAVLSDPVGTYRYRLVAEGSNGFPSTSAGRTFTVTGSLPSTAGATASDIGPAGATLKAKVNPQMAPTVYRFEYGLSTDYGSATPTSDSIGSDGTDHDVSATVRGLDSGTTYHFRVVAINFNGVTDGPDGTFSTPGGPVGPTVAAGTQSAPTPSAFVQTSSAKNKKRCKRGFVRKMGKCRKRKHGAGGRR
jgi:sugar lactone lactonase YvrE